MSTRPRPILAVVLLLLAAAGSCLAQQPPLVLPPPLPATTAPAVNTTSVSGTVLVGVKPLVGAVVWLRVPDGKGGFGPDLHSYPITAQHGYTFALTAGYWQLHVVPPAGYAVVGDNPLTVTTAAFLPATVNFAAVPVATPAAVVTPTPATAPAAVPTTVPATFSTGCGAAEAVQAVYHAGQAPCAAWFDARPLGSTRADRRAWNFGDTPDPRPNPKHLLDPVNYPAPTIDGNLLADAECPCHVYRTPGTYTVTLADARPTGAVDHYAATVVVDPDTRQQRYIGPAGNDANAGTTPATAWASAARFAAAVADNTHVHVLPGTPDLSLVAHGCVRMRRSCVVELLADPATGKRPVLTVGNLAAFDGWDGQTDGFLLIGGQVTSPTTPATKNGVAYQAGVLGSKVISVRGTNVVMLDVELGYLNYGMKVEDGDGAAIIGSTMVDPFCLAAAAVCQFSGTGRVFIRHNRLDSPDGESTSRTDGAGGEGLTVADNLLLNTHPAVDGKSVFAGRDLLRATFTGNAFGAEIGFSSTDGEAGVLVSDILIRSNLFRGGDININPRVDGIAIVDNDMDQGPQITLTASGPLGTLQNVTATGNTTVGAAWRVKVAGTVPGLVTDAGRAGVGAPATRPAN